MKEHICDPISCANCTGEEDKKLDSCCAQQMDGDGFPARCVGDWSEDKLFYFKRYCDIFVSGMKNKWTNLVFADLFAGPGRCRVRPNGRFTNGSPLIALEKGFTHYYFGDLSEYCIDALEKRIAKFCFAKKDIQLASDDANRFVIRLVSNIRQLGKSTISFTFIDPPGIEIKFSSIEQLSQIPHMDLLINFPLGMNLKRQYKHQLQKETNEAFAFDSFFGTKEWRDACTDSPGYVGKNMLDLYERQLKKAGFSFVGDEQTVKQKGRSLYMLIYASKNPRGEEFWNKVTKISPTGQKNLF